MRFFDGDEVIPPDIRERIQAFKPLLPVMLDRYVGAYLAPGILQRMPPNGMEPGLVVAQALYRRRHRQTLRHTLESCGLEVEFQHVKVPFQQQMRQLWGRERGLKWVFYALYNKPFFEP